MNYSTAKKYCTILTGIAAIMVAMSFRVMSDSGKLIIHFENFVADKRLSLDSATYTNAVGQPFTVTNFKYYISNIKLKDSHGKISGYSEGYYLIKADDESTWTAELDNVPAGNYGSISFMIGVDSLHNCSGAQSGALDPINGMFWTWNTGYIFVKLEGKSPASKQPGHIFEYHIGGYKEPTNFIRNTSLTFAKEPMNIKTAKTTQLYIKADAAKILNGQNKVDFSKLPSVTDFHNSDKIADNYVNMFSIIRISNEW